MNFLFFKWVRTPVRRVVAQPAIDFLVTPSKDAQWMQPLTGGIGTLCSRQRPDMPSTASRYTFPNVTRGCYTEARSHISVFLTLHVSLKISFLVEFLVLEVFTLKSFGAFWTNFNLQFPKRLSRITRNFFFIPPTTNNVFSHNSSLYLLTPHFSPLFRLILRDSS